MNGRMCLFIIFFCSLWSKSSTFPKYLLGITVIQTQMSFFFHSVVCSCFRPHLLPGKGEASLSSSSRSLRDVFRQMYSVTWHPRLLYLIVSDGYMATVIRVLGKPSAGLLLKGLIKNTTEDLEKASGILEKSQVTHTFVQTRSHYPNQKHSFPNIHYF